MTKNEFINILRLELRRQGIADYEDIANYYEEIIDGKIEAGLSEQEALKNYTDTDAIIKEIVSENVANKSFTYSDFVQEKQRMTGSIVLPTKKSGAFTHQVAINNQSSLIVNVWDRKVKISSSPSVNSVSINYQKKLFKPLEVRTEGNDIKILERSGCRWFSFLFHTMLFLIAYFVCLEIAALFVDKFLGWYYLVVAVVASSLVNLLILFVWLLFKKDKRLEIFVPERTTLISLKTIVKSGRIEIEDLITKNMSLKVMSGTIKLLNSAADEVEIKVSSGTAILGERDRKLPYKISRLNLITSSGFIKVHGISANNLTSKTSSGSLKLYNSEFNVTNLKCSSGSIKGDDLALLENTIVVSSGNVKLNNIFLGTSNLKVSSGTIKLNEIKEKEENFMISSQVSSGVVRINNKKITTLGYKLVTELPKKTITMRVSSGTINLSFNQLNQ